jgi:hypothetical protein
MLTAKLRHLAYGAFAEKEWRVSTAPMPAGWSPLHPEALDEPANWTELPQLKPYRFLADPFFAPDGAVLAEAMRPDGRGTIVRLADGALREVTLVGRGHVSYPSILQTDGVTFLLPEIASWSPQRLYQLDGESTADLGPLHVTGHPRLLDPTLFSHDGRFYLFGNLREEGSGVLRLWSADYVRGPYAEHPDSPIRISPKEAEWVARCSFTKAEFTVRARISAAPSGMASASSRSRRSPLRSMRSGYPAAFAFAPAAVRIR